MMKAIKNFMKKLLLGATALSGAVLLWDCMQQSSGQSLLTRSGSLIRTRQRGLINTIHSEI